MGAPTVESGRVGELLVRSREKLRREMGSDLTAGVTSMGLVVVGTWLADGAVTRDTAGRAAVGFSSTLMTVDGFTLACGEACRAMPGNATPPLPKIG